MVLTKFTWFLKSISSSLPISWPVWPGSHGKVYITNYTMRIYLSHNNKVTLCQAQFLICRSTKRMHYLQEDDARSTLACTHGWSTVKIPRFPYCVNWSDYKIFLHLVSVSSFICLYGYQKNHQQWNTWRLQCVTGIFLIFQKNILVETLNNKWSVFNFTIFLFHNKYSIVLKTQKTSFILNIIFLSSTTVQKLLFQI